MTEKRRYTGQQTELIPAGGDWDEWFRIRTTVTMDDLAMFETEMSGDKNTLTSRAIEVVNRMVERMLVAWSLEEPLTPQTLKTLPYEMVQPLFTAVSGFLTKAQSAQSSPTTNLKSSPESVTTSSSPDTTTTMP